MNEAETKEMVEFDPVAHREKWLQRLKDELDKIEPLMPIKLLPEGVEYPQWVQNVEREFAQVMFPVAKLKEPDVKMTPKRMGAMLGHMCESAVWMKDWIESQIESRDTADAEPATESTANEEAIKKGVEILIGLDAFDFIARA
jgi:hypothetical protein